MLQLSSALLNRPVLSLRTNGVVATAYAPLINPNNLKIEGFYCLTHATKQNLILLYQDIRDVIPQGIVVNDLDALTEASELVRLQKIIALHFELINKPVFTANKHKLGKVSDFATETTTMFVQKIYVSQSIFKSFSGGNLGIDRTQIIEITDRKIVVNDLAATVRASATAPA